MIDPAISEKDFQQLVIGVARANGWLTFHAYDSRRSEAGFPDLCMVRGKRLIFAELKSRKGRMSAGQVVWLLLLSGTRLLEVYTWRPCDWDDIVKMLAEGDHEDKVVQDQAEGKEGDEVR